LQEPQTYIQSGNVIFKTDESDLSALTKRIEIGIERKFGFRSDVILRTSSDLRSVVSRNPFAKRRDVHPSRFLVTFLAGDPGEDARNQIRTMKADPEEVWLDGRELYIYFPNGMARPKLSTVQIERTLKIPGTGRNWNSVTKLLELAERMEASERLERA